jgi:hypothetical protein
MSMMRESSSGQAPQRPRRRGQGIVEFALAAPVFVILLFGIVEFSWFVFVSTNASHAAHEGARRGMVLGRTANSFTTSGNSPGTYPAPLSVCDPSVTTIMGTVSCRLTPVDLTRTSGEIRLLNTNGTVATGPFTDIVPAGLRIEVTVRHRYQPLVASMFSVFADYVVTGSSEVLSQ